MKDKDDDLLDAIRRRIRALELPIGVNVKPTRLTPEDLPTLRKLAVFFRERKAAERARAKAERRIIRQMFSRVLPEAVSNAFADFTDRAIAAIERTGHLASDERVDEDGRASKP